RHQRQQLTNTAGLRQRFVAEMGIDIEVVILDPEWLAEAVLQALVERSHRAAVIAHLLRQVTDVLGAGILGKTEQLQARHMHRLLATLEKKKQLVYRGQRLHLPSLCSGYVLCHRPAAGDNCRASLRSVLAAPVAHRRSEEHTSELQSRENLVCRLLLAK